jgi:hypothetical protein
MIQKRGHISTLGLACPRELVLVEVDGKMSYFEGVTCPPFSILAINKFNKYLI